ncbi:hypothetical protein [Acinetobacter radioresistens]|uniref:hypothetical protein n=1 Tax=Acinetobacter radioresistens TaxID=40216 RepID=UPI0032154F6F
MAKGINDKEIEAFKKMQKFLTKPLKQKWTTNHKVRQLSIELYSGDHFFKIYMRQSTVDEDNFSCGISLISNGKNDITLARYNGSNHVHVNKCDGRRFDFECHIHTANEASLKASKKIENYAEPTNRYTNLQGAIQCALRDFHIMDLSIGQLIEQGGLFDNEIRFS